MPEFEPMKPPDNLVDNMIRDMVSEAWLICSKVTLVKTSEVNQIFVCSDTRRQCFPFQQERECKNNPLNRGTIK